MYRKSLHERLQSVIEDACAACGAGPTMSVGDGGFTGDADPEGPVAGYDPPLGKVRRQRKKRRGVNENKKPLPDFKMILKASELENRKGKDKEEDQQNYERARKIRNQIK
jgi:hypothetical protein